MTKEIVDSSENGGVKDPSRRRFLRRVGVAIVGGSVAAFAGTSLGLGKITSDMKSEAEKEASLSYSPPNKQDYKNASQYIQDTANNRASLDTPRLDESYKVIRQQNAYDEARLGILDKKHYGEIYVVRAFGPLMAIPVGATGVGLYLDNREPKSETSNSTTVNPTTT